MRTVLLACLFVLLSCLPVQGQQLDARYYTLDLPQDWKVDIAPRWEGQSVSLKVARSDGKADVTIIIGPTHDADMEIIASMFAQMFQAKLPLERQGHFYTTSFQKDAVSGRLWIAEDKGLFIVYSLAGDTEAGLSLLRNGLKSTDYPGLVLH